MKRLFLLASFILLSSPAWATWGTPTQIVSNNSCPASTSCNVTVAALGAGHFIGVQTHTPNGSNQYLLSVTASGETFVGGSGTCVPNVGSNSTGFENGCAYTFKAVGGATTVTANWSASVSAGGSVTVYDIPYTAPFLFFDTNHTTTGPQTAGMTFPGINFGADGSFSSSTWGQGTSDVCFQMADVASGTVSAINSSYVLDNHVGQVADAHLLNTFTSTSTGGGGLPETVAPTWTNSASATSLVSAWCVGEDYNPRTLTAIPASTPSANGLQLSYGSADQLVFSNPGPGLTVISPGQFKLVFSFNWNWGISSWYDLVNDPNATTDLLLDPAGGPSTITTLYNRVYYDYKDSSLYTSDGRLGTPLASAPRQITVLEYNSSRVVIETKSQPFLFNDLVSTTRYYIYPDGKIYYHHVATTTLAFTFSGGNLWGAFTVLADAGVTPTLFPDTAGWIRASKTQNPYTNVASAEPYLFAYWSPSTPQPNTNHTKASIMLVRSPNNLHDGAQTIFTDAGRRVMRWGWTNTASDPVALGAGGTETEDGLIQLGTQNSTVLPNFTVSGACAICDTIANAYIANPTPPLPTSQYILIL